jgi:ABC-type amino acid transport substrate-binding protein
MTFRLRLHYLLAIFSIPLAAATPAGADGTLRVCLEQNSPPLSFKHQNSSYGFDLAVAQGVASRLGRELAIQWFESKVDKDSNPSLKANALLSDGRCQVIAGYPLFASALGVPKAERSRLPDYEGAKPEDRRRWVPLNELIASIGYRFAPLGVVLGPNMANHQIRSLGDLKDLRLVVEEGTLADAVLMTYGGGILVDRIEHVAPGQAIFEKMEQGEYDATLVDLHRLDAHYAHHQGSKLAWSGHYHSIGFNTGFVGLASEAPLVAELNVAIGEMLAKQELQALAQATGLTYLPPRQPDVLTTISRAQLRGD